MTSQQPHNSDFADPDLAATEVIPIAAPAPVFVDSTGRRRRLLRRFAYGFGAFCLAYGGLISLSIVGGPGSPSLVLPFPALAEGAQEQPADRRLAPTPEPAAPAPRAVLVNEALPQHAAATRQQRSGNHPATGGPTDNGRSGSTATPTSPRPLEHAGTSGSRSAPAPTRPEHSSAGPTSAPPGIPVPLPPVPQDSTSGGEPTGGSGGNIDQPPTSPGPDPAPSGSAAPPGDSAAPPGDSTAPPGDVDNGSTEATPDGSTEATPDEAGGDPTPPVVDEAPPVSARPLPAEVSGSRRPARALPVHRLRPHQVGWVQRGWQQRHSYWRAP